MFRAAAIRLAGLYLGILLVISLFFSAVIYQVSTTELDRGLRRPGEMWLEGRGANRLGPVLLEELQAEREEQFQLAKDRILNRLVLINLSILGLGGFLSYYLALRTLKPIEEAHQAQSRFTADASHELRTPIAAMRSETEVALMNPKLTLTEAKDILNSNLEELAKLTALSEGLLKLAKLEHGHLVSTTVSVDGVVKDAIARMAAEAIKKQIDIVSDNQSAASVRGDKTSLIEALVIILDNAIKYSPSGSTVKVITASANKKVTISIIDKGIGIKASELPYIYDRFYRADTSRSKVAAPGYGIGLAIAKNIIDLHRGSIIVDSKPGKGTAFKLILPVA